MHIALVIFVLSVLLFASGKVLLRLAIITLLLIGGSAWVIVNHNEHGAKLHAEQVSARHAFFDNCERLRLRKPDPATDNLPSVVIGKIRCANPGEWAPRE